MNKYKFTIDGADYTALFGLTAQYLFQAIVGTDVKTDLSPQEASERGLVALACSIPELGIKPSDSKGNVVLAITTLLDKTDNPEAELNALTAAIFPQENEAAKAVKKPYRRGVKKA